MLLDTSELLKLEDAIRQRLATDLTRLLCEFNRAGELDEALSKWGMADLLYPNNGYQPYKDGKILVIGDSQVKKEHLLAVAKDLGINKNRFEFVLSYEEGKMYDTSKTQWNESYCLILFGPLPHSGIAKGDFGSKIESAKNEAGYPPVKMLVANEQLKITKNNFKQALETAIAEDVIWRG